MTTARSQDCWSGCSIRRTGPTRIRSMRRSASSDRSASRIQPDGVLVVPGLRRRAAPPVVGERFPRRRPRCRGGPGADDADEFGDPSFLFLDPPDHTRLRRLVSKAFVPKVVKALEPDITALVDSGLLDGVDAEGRLRRDRRSRSSAAGRGDLPSARRAAGGRARVQRGLGAVGPVAGSVHHVHRPGSRQPRQPACRPRCGCTSTFAT